jgi:hypothetical protein
MPPAHMNECKSTINLLIPLMVLMRVTAITLANDLSDGLKDPASDFSQITNDEQLAKLGDKDGVEYFNALPAIQLSVLQLDTLRHWACSTPQSARFSTPTVLCTFHFRDDGARRRNALNAQNPY